MEIKKRFGENVRAKRQAAGLSQEDLAHRIDADQAYVSRIESGQMNVTLETAQQIAGAIGAPLADLLQET